jgi:hypothetical protein
MTMACRRVISRSRTNGEVEKVLIAIICPNVRCNKTRDVFFFLELEYFILSKLEILCYINYHGCLCDICLEDCIGARNERGDVCPGSSKNDGW